jgi:hypothetical protein
VDLSGVISGLGYIVLNQGSALENGDLRSLTSNLNIHLEPANGTSVAALAASLLESLFVELKGILI